MSRRIFVGNVNDRISEDRLRRHFEAVGEVTSVTIPADRKTGRSRGYAFVEFGSLPVRQVRLLGRRRPPRQHIDLDEIAEDAIQRFESQSEERRPSPGRQMKEPF